MAPLAKVARPEALARFTALPRKVSVCVASKGMSNEGLQLDLPLAVGSTFELSILAALRDRIFRLLQEWPDKTPLTVSSLAGLLISLRDNTASDVLLVGRTRVEPRGSRNKPLISTRQKFVLKAKTSEPLLTRWRSGDETSRR